uniref:Uncharacterized protein n=1 Tax=Oryza nivara TaxID=4536 RepID=A0A0E0G8W1_ORYNI
MYCICCLNRPFVYRTAYTYGKAGANLPESSVAMHEETKAVKSGLSRRTATQPWMSFQAQQRAIAPWLLAFPCDGGRQAGSQRRRRVSDCFLLGWEPPFGCLGILAGIGAAGTNVYGVVHLHAFAMASCCRGSYQGKKYRVNMA